MQIRRDELEPDLLPRLPECRRLAARPRSFRRQAKEAQQREHPDLLQEVPVSSQSLVRVVWSYDDHSKILVIWLPLPPRSLARSARPSPRSPTPRDRARRIAPCG